MLILVNVVGYAQRKPKIKGNRNVIEVMEELPPFHTIVLEDDLEVVLKPGADFGYELEADDNLVDLLRFKVENEILTISSFYRITRKKKLNISVFFNQLNHIAIKSGKIVARDSFPTDALSVDIRGGGKAEMDLSINVLEITMDENSSGDFKMNGDSLNIVLKDKSKLKLFAVSEAIKVQLEKNSNALLEGFSSHLHISLMDNATLKARKLEVDTVVASLDARASAEILVINSLELFASGSSKTYVYGEGKINLQEFLDTSELYRRNY